MIITTIENNKSKNEDFIYVFRIIFILFMSITSKKPRDFNLAISSTPDNIGPGVYNPSFTHYRYRAKIPFGSTTRRDTFNIDSNPDIGPGCYNPEKPRHLHSTIASFSLSGQRSFFVNGEESPGPAAYGSLEDWSRGIRRAPKSSLSNDPDKSYNSLFSAITLNGNAPGPGEYDIKMQKGGRAADFSRSKVPQREPVVNNGIPGPGHYNIDQQTSKKLNQSHFFVTKNERDIFANDNVNDCYMLEHKAWRAVTPTKGPFGGRQKRSIYDIDSSIPGPGQYFVNANASELVTKSPGNKKRGGLGSDRSIMGSFANTNMDGPGPGYYETNYATSAKVVLPKTERKYLWDLNKNTNPGPGAYKTEMSSIEVPRSKLRVPSPPFLASGERDFLMLNKLSPGPAKYNIDYKYNSHGISIGKSKRFTEGAYIGNVKLSDTPGPATYDDPPAKSVRLAQLGPKRFKEKYNDNPGPGHYNNVHASLVKPTFNVKLDEK